MKKSFANKYTKKNEALYYKILSEMTGEERMKRAFEMCRFMWEVAAAGIKHQFQNITEDELKNKLRQRLHR